MYNLLDLLVWGRRSRTWSRWIYGRQLRNEEAWLLYGLPLVYLASKGEE